MTETDIKLAVYERLAEFSEKLSDEEAEALKAWEHEHVKGDGLLGTSDWPSWESVISRLNN